MFPASAVPLLLRFAAAAITGAAALVALRSVHREEAVSALRRDVRDALRRLDEPPAVLVTGFRAHGKSALINTACRALAAEAGPVLLRTETAPRGPGGATLARQVVRAAVARGSSDEEEEEEGGGSEDEEDEDAVVEMVDAPALPEPGILTRSDVEAAVCGSPGNPPPDCVMLVLRCGGQSKESRVAVKKLADIATVVRERGLQFVVVLTHKKHIKSKRQAEELRREIALRARTDCVYFIENYTAGNMLHLRRPWTSKNNFETHFTVLTMMRQCIEFTKLHRSNLARKANDNANIGRLP
ncbi:hypothetical protein C4D60_Mb02t10990 [Musa balbisiana]|uniref:G domain-containing protein n=1 Tax=Musa balbisiana TaxID=52838 RepID=A0A4S8IC57_MUSBA|nr:hypothetical protein C4D60_Mb02t10990 [Musa balbisiana]